MWTLEVLIISCAVLVVSAVSNAPGAVAIWQAGGNITGAKRLTNTKTTDASAVSSYLSGRLASGSEAVVVFSSSDGRPALQHSSVSSAVSKSSDCIIMSAVYSSDSKKPQSEVTKAAIFGAKGMNPTVQKLSLVEMLGLVQEADSSKNPLTNGMLDTFEIVLTGHESEHETMDQLSSLVGDSMLFVALQEPTAQAPMTKAHYSRILASSSNLLDGVFYKPEGAEYSIYYADTYLYITPDIFTGLLSGFFFLATVIVGFSCMNQIQGPTSFSHKEHVPAIGREA